MAALKRIGFTRASSTPRLPATLLLTASAGRELLRALGRLPQWFASPSFHRLPAAPRAVRRLRPSDETPWWTGSMPMQPAARNRPAPWLYPNPADPARARRLGPRQPGSEWQRRMRTLAIRLSKGQHRRDYTGAPMKHG